MGEKPAVPAFASAKTAKEVTDNAPAKAIRLIPIQTAGRWLSVSSFFSLRGFKLVPAQAVFFDSLHGFDDIGVEGLVFDFRVLLVKVGGRRFKNAGHFWKGKELDAAEFVFLFSLDDSVVGGLSCVFDLPFGGESFGDFGLDLRIFVCVSFLFNLRDADATPLTIDVDFPPPSVSDRQKKIPIQVISRRQILPRNQRCEECSSFQVKRMCKHGNVAD